jgi:hypothetical protein
MIVPLLAAALLAPAGLAACGNDKPNPAGSVLDRDQLESDISSRLEKAGAGTAPPVTCPADLPTQKNASIRCKATISGENYGVTVTITGGSGQNAVYALTVDQKPS